MCYTYSEDFFIGFGMYVCLCIHKYICVSMYTKVQVPSEAERGARFSRAELKRSCEPPNMGARNQILVL